jgi:hypothetical protein
MSLDLTALKSGVNLADLVELQHELQPGKRYRKAKNHNSLVVDTQTQAYYWNSRGESGDVVDWIGRHCLNYNGQWNSADPTLFKEAVCWLAKHTGQPQPQFKPEDPVIRAERLNRERLMKLAADYYRQTMNGEIQGYQYALGRGFAPETIARLGYANGQLWQHIPEADRPLAAELGLIVIDGRRRYDAIPNGYLVYVHEHRRQVEYFSGRAISQKQHMNQRGNKKMLWADWPGFGPLVVVEGQADAYSVAQLGVSALGLCGVNLADFDPDWLRLYGPIYVWPDDDEPGSNAAKAWEKRLADLVTALGPMVRIIKAAGHKDANDFLKAGAAADDLQSLLAGAVTWPDAEIGRVAALQGADQYDALQPLFGHLAAMDIFQLNVYRSKICKDLNISHGDFGRYLKAAKGTLTDDEESEFAKGGQYTLIDGWTVLRHFTDDGKPRLTPLSNGAAKILEEVLRDDGSNEPTMEYIIGGELHTGHKLPKIEVPAAEFNGMKWLSKWGSRFILSAGRNTQDHFRAAVQYRSGAPHRRMVYTHTGWRKIGNSMVFLTSGGALGSSNDDIQVDLKMGRTDTNMTRYTLPLAPENITDAILASLAYWNIADLSITVPIWAAMYLSPLMPFLVADFGLWVHGQTGSMKSSMVACALAHWGQWQGKEAKVFLPSNFQSTSNNILMNAFQAKDVPLVIDDFAPGATAREVKERDATASNLLRSVGNKAARGRMRDGRTYQADFPPRCLAIITAEDLPSTASIMARGIGVRVHIPPKGDPARRPIEQRLGRAQTKDSILYPHAMAAYITWISRHWDQLARDLPVMAGDYRDKIQSGGHARLPDAFGKLMAAVDTALFFALDTGALTDSQAKIRKQQAFEAMGIILFEHGEAVESVDACKIFHEILVEHLDARLWYLCPTTADSVNPPGSYPLGAVLVGYTDDSFIYLLSKTVTDIMTHYQRLGTPFPVGRNTLYRRLAERGWLVSGSGKASDTVYIPVLNASPRVLKLKKDVFLA